MRSTASELKPTLAPVNLCRSLTILSEALDGMKLCNGLIPKRSTPQPEAPLPPCSRLSSIATLLPLNGHICGTTNRPQHRDRPLSYGGSTDVKRRLSLRWFHYSIEYSILRRPRMVKMGSCSQSQSTMIEVLPFSNIAVVPLDTLRSQLSTSNVLCSNVHDLLNTR